jgi:hypothetical protein
MKGEVLHFGRVSPSPRRLRGEGGAQRRMRGSIEAGAKDSGCFFELLNGGYFPTFGAAPHPPFGHLLPARGGARGKTTDIVSGAAL